MKRFLLIAAFCLGFLGHLFATHNRAGEIIYWHISGLTYGFKIITYTNAEPGAADRPELDIVWGDGTPISTFPRTDSNIVAPQVQKNVYTGQHTFSGPGTFLITMTDPNRNEGIINLGGSASVNIPFHIDVEIVISPFLHVNNSVEFFNPPIEDACTGKPWVHNPAAFDADGDSLSFELAIPMSGPDTTIPTYSEPPGLSINPLTGIITWNVPSGTLIGEYNIAFVATEYDRATGLKIGSVRRDMQIRVLACTNNPPEIESVNDTCVKAGDLLSFGVTATDPDGHFLTLTSSGSPYMEAVSPASFANGSGVTPVTGFFNWNTTCDHVQEILYPVYFFAEDGGAGVDVPLVASSTMNIKVIAPGPENPLATPSGNSMVLNWDKSICTDAIGYRIYRKIDSLGFSPTACQTGVPNGIGYNLIGDVGDVNTTSFTDLGDLVTGQQYCYMVVAYFPDGGESYASLEFCNELIKDVPIITHVTVNSTDPSSGSDSIMWSAPTEIDSLVAFPGPYSYRVYRADGFGTPLQLVHTTPSSANLYQTDTIFVDTFLDTESQAYSYQVALFSGSDSVGTTNTASSIFLSTVPNDNEVALNWSVQVPWINNEYVIYRFDNLSSTWIALDTVVGTSYVDTGLVNGVEYCYYVKSFGEYFTDGILNPLLNNSQEACASPIDLTPPCAPDLSLDNDCQNILNSLSWNNPNNSCADDVVGYRIYFTPLQDGELQLIDSVLDATDTNYFHNYFNSVAGCYTVTAIDSFYNESPHSDTVCGDNCPAYELPNVFTPNDDGQNDIYHPVINNFVESIDFRVYNRWGEPVFSTDDPNINWDGTRDDNGELLTDGVYYYICRVNEIRLTGIESRDLKGNISIFTESSGTQN